jgi:hypothetical protein
MYANGKMMPVETGIILGMMSQNGGVGGEFKYDIFDILQEFL